MTNYNKILKNIEALPDVSIKLGCDWNTRSIRVVTPKSSFSFYFNKMDYADIEYMLTSYDDVPTEVLRDLELL